MKIMYAGNFGLVEVLATRNDDFFLCKFLVPNERYGHNGHELEFHEYCNGNCWYFKKTQLQYFEFNNHIMEVKK